MDRIIGLWALLILRPVFVLGILIAAIGIGLMVFAGGYFALGVYSESSLDELTVTQAETGLTEEDLTHGLATPVNTALPTSTPPPTVVPTTRSAVVASTSAPESSPSAATAEAGQQEATGATIEDGITESADAAADSLYDEFGVLQDLSHYLAEAQGDPFSMPIDAEFHPLTPGDLVQTYGEQPRPTHISIPAIDLKSSIVDLSIVWDGGDSEWQTADHAVGFHIGSATPGEIGNSVMSGHVRSPFADEGSIFARLDEVAPMLRRGEIVDIVVLAGGDVYLYRATDTTVMLPEDVDVFDLSDGPTLSLVTCAPATTFSHRFIVNARLVGVARL